MDKMDKTSMFLFKMKQSLLAEVMFFLFSLCCLKDFLRPEEVNVSVNSFIWRNNLTDSALHCLMADRLKNSTKINAAEPDIVFLFRHLFFFLKIWCLHYQQCNFTIFHLESWV